jgi:hypothetical protein
MFFKMFSKRGAREERNPELLPAISLEAAAGMEKVGSVMQQAEGSRLVYERIAQGNALADAEENAMRKWRG